MINIVVADDHAFIRAGIRSVLEAVQDISVCGEAADGLEALEQVEQHAPDVLILDITMPGLSGLEALDRIRSLHPSVKTILLSMHGEPPIIHSGVALGADAYVLKDAPSEEILAAIRAVTHGGNYFSPRVAREITAKFREGPEEPDPFSRLSGRELEVLRRIAQGQAAKEIASALGISTKTVEAHRTSLMRKLGVRKATELVRCAIRHGLIEA